MQEGNEYKISSQNQKFGILPEYFKISDIDLSYNYLIGNGHMSKSQKNNDVRKLIEQDDESDDSNDISSE